MSTRITNMEQYHTAYKQSIEQPELFWEQIAGNFTWKKKWDKILQWDFDQFNVKWFDGAQLNITENCLDRHAKSNPERIAIIWEPNDPYEPIRKITYSELLKEVCRVSNMLKKFGVKKGERVCIYMPMIPEAAFAMLACARIGAIHSVVFAGFSAASLSDRINDAECSLVLTTDGAYRGAKKLQLKR